MKLEVTVSEIADIFKEIQEQPGRLFEMIRLDIREVVGRYLTAMMNAELTHFLGREPYIRVSGAVNWKMSECHLAYWHLLPTIDHIIPIEPPRFFRRLC